MKRKFLGRISVRTTPEAEDAIAELLHETLGLPASSYRDHETDASTVTVYLQRKLDSPHQVRGRIFAGLKRISSCGLNIGPGKIAMARVRWEDWAESWKRHFRPIEIGDALLIKPSWSKCRARKGQAVVVLDPGLSFGTGNHPTTAFCLRALAEFRTPGASQSCLDIGTGSGILAIAAAKLGYAPVRAMDFDAEAVRIARANARRNRVRIQIQQQDVARLPKRSREKYDFICANLISDLLLAEIVRITARLRPGGGLALAGILKEEFPQIARACKRAGLKLVRARRQGEWRSGLFLLREGTDAGPA